MNKFEKGKLKIKHALITTEEILIATLENRIYSFENSKFRKKLLKIIEKEVSAYIEALKCAEE